jgi:MFS family permease
MNNVERAGQRTAFVLLISQSLFSASSIIAFTVGSIIVVQLADSNSQWTGVPSTLALVGAALVVYPVGRLMDRVGRRVGLSLGYIFGISGALVTGWAVVEQSLPVFIGPRLPDSSSLNGSGLAGFGPVLAWPGVELLFCRRFDSP